MVVSCREARLEMVRLLYGERARAGARDHLKMCHRCGEERDAFREVVRGIPDTPLPQRLRDGLAALGRIRVRRVPRPVVIGIAAALLLVAGVATITWAMRHPTPVAVRQVAVFADFRAPEDRALQRIASEVHLQAVQTATSGVDISMETAVKQAAEASSGADWDSCVDVALSGVARRLRALEGGLFE